MDGHEFVLRLEVLFARSQVVKRHFLSHEVLFVVPTTLNFFDSYRKSTRKILFLAKHGTHLIFCSSPFGKGLTLSFFLPKELSTAATNCLKTN